MADRGNIVHVMGTGTIGEPLIGLFSDLRKELGIDEVTFYKHTPRETDRAMIRELTDKGAVLTVAEDKVDEFEAIGLEPELTRDEALDRARVVVDAAPGGVGMDNKEQLYKPRTDTTDGFLAQGSEAGFGTPYALGINDDALTDEQFLHVVSCNTHNIAVILKTLGLEPDGDRYVDHVDAARFVCFRRGSDVTDGKGTVPAPRISLHDSDVGTHHAEDVRDLYATLDLDLDVRSSALKTNTQYMHTIWFDLRLDEPIDEGDARQRFRDAPRVATTDKRLSNLVFAHGRDHGYFGRILDQTVACLPSIQTAGDEVYGFCFTPQDGNTILSSAAGVLRFLHGDDYLDRVDVFDRFYFDEI